MSVYGRHWCYRLLRYGHTCPKLNYYATKVRSLRRVHLASCVQKEERPGHTRYLRDPKDTWKYNNWDDAEWDEEQEEQAKLKVLENSSDLVSEDMREKYEAEADSFWDHFYSQHQNRFFKDRHWLFVQFPELAPKGYIPKDEHANNSENSSESSKKLATDAEKPANENSAPTTSIEHSDTNDGVQKDKMVVQGIQGDETVTITPEQAKKLLERASEGAGRSEQDKQDDVCQGVQGQVGMDQGKDQGKDEGLEGSLSKESFPGEHSNFRIFEVGCGVGNTVFPVLQTNKDPELFVYCCDLSETAIQIIRDHEEYEPKRCHAFVGDVTDLDKPLPFPEESLDCVICIFVLSAIHPDKMQATVSRLARCLKPGGMMLFRDYGRYDMVQLRFKSGKCLSPNFYVRGDGTRVYFFTQDELRGIFRTAGLTEEVQNFQDRRLQVNRGRQLKMYRVWIQCKYRKPLNSS